MLRSAEHECVDGKSYGDRTTTQQGVTINNITSFKQTKLGQGCCGHGQRHRVHCGDVAEGAGGAGGGGVHVGGGHGWWKWWM